MTTMLTVEKLSKIFTLHQQGGVRIKALTDVSLELSAGECLALAGPSGAGKSTLLRCLYGNYLPSGGKISLRHLSEILDLSAASPQKIMEVRRYSLGYVSQFLRVIPRVSALDIVAEPLLETGAETAEARQAARELLNRLNIPPRLWALPPATFSGGEQQRINLARGFIRLRPVMLLDEPTASLDRANRKVVRDLIYEAKESGSALIGIFHDDEMRSLVADRQFQMAPPNGREKAE
ncbi:MAG: phosphonate C-P lyase system protein PhnL [Candidatus Adiutrix sp.]|jgi:alpha-D-ribose 1-methylphosphonate 5-triphosphate synthase subunit PhnL|nr:phosphonate C-P lyase system protein PhnL [Candidatus Adiutrix sp.]